MPAAAKPKAPRKGAASGTDARGKPAPAGRPTATTPCPGCGHALPIRGERGACPACGLAVRFVDAPERPCVACGAPVTFPPGRDAVRCPACAAWQASDPSRPLQARTTCPRCRRRLDAPLHGRHMVCPHCRSPLALADAL